MLKLLPWTCIGFGGLSVQVPSVGWLVCVSLNNTAVYSLTVKKMSQTNVKMLMRLSEHVHTASPR